MAGGTTAILNMVNRYSVLPACLALLRAFAHTNSLEPHDHPVRELRHELELK